MPARRAILLAGLGIVAAKAASRYAMHRLVCAVVAPLPAQDDPMTEFYAYMEQRYEEDNQ